MFSQLYKWAAIVFAVLAVAAVLATFYFRANAAGADLRADAEHARANVLAQQVIRADEIIREERERAANMALIAAEYEQDKADAVQAADRTIADLRAGTVRLRDEWAGCATDSVSATATAARLADESAAVRARAAAEIVSIGARADAQVRALQAVVRADRE